MKVFEEKVRVPTVRELLRGKVPEDLIPLVRRSYDIIGDIAVLEIPEELKDYEREIAEAIMKIHKNVRVVCKKVGIVEGVERVRKVEIILGEKRTTTIHKENGIRLKVDISKVFYTPRLSQERLRIAKKVREGEVVTDLFAGVGPYSILIARISKPKVVYAIDINPHAYELLVENVKMNKVEGVVKPFLGDCREVVEREKLIGVADRVIMNLPKDAGDFLDVAYKVSKGESVIHFYCFLYEEGLFEEGIRIIEEKAKELGFDFEILETVKCGEIGPRRYRVCIDFKMLK